VLPVGTDTLDAEELGELLQPDGIQLGHGARVYLRRKQRRKRPSPNRGLQAYGS
jgi:hypothetical protein